LIIVQLRQKAAKAAFLQAKSSLQGSVMNRDPRLCTATHVLVSIKSAHLTGAV
jgi:hypothetical protein